MIKRMNLNAVLFNEYATEWGGISITDDSSSNLFIDDDFELVEEGIQPTLHSNCIIKENLYNTCILQSENTNQLIEFKAVNNNDGTFTYTILVPSGLVANSYVPIYELANVNKNMNVFKTTIDKCGILQNTLSGYIKSKNMSLEKIQMYMEVLRIKLLIKESMISDGYDISTLLVALSKFIMIGEYDSDIDFAKTMLTFKSMVKLNKVDELRKAGLVYVCIHDEGDILLPVHQIMFVDGLIVFMVNTKIIRNIYAITLGFDTIITKSHYIDTEGGKLKLVDQVNNSVTASIEDMIDLELNPHLRKAFKLINCR